MQYRCRECGKAFGEEFARDNHYRCVVTCGGTLEIAGEHSYRLPDETPSLGYIEGLIAAGGEDSGTKPGHMLVEYRAAKDAGALLEFVMEAIDPTDASQEADKTTRRASRIRRHRSSFITGAAETTVLREFAAEAEGKRQAGHFTHTDALLEANLIRNDSEHAIKRAAWERQSDARKRQLALAATKVTVSGIRDLLQHLPPHVARAVEGDQLPSPQRPPEREASVERIDVHDVTSGEESGLRIRVSFFVRGDWTERQVLIGAWFTLDGQRLRGGGELDAAGRSRGARVGPDDGDWLRVVAAPLDPGRQRQWDAFELFLPYHRVPPVTGEHILGYTLRIFSGAAHRDGRRGTRSHWSLVHAGQEQRRPLHLPPTSTIDFADSVEAEDKDAWDRHTLGRRMRITFTASRMKGLEGTLVVFFENAAGARLRDADDFYSDLEGNVALPRDFRPGADHQNFKEELFIPYSQLHLPGGQHEVGFRAVVFWRDRPGHGHELARGGLRSFTFTQRAHIGSVSHDCDQRTAKGEACLTIYVSLTLLGMKDRRLVVQVFFSGEGGPLTFPDGAAAQELVPITTEVDHEVRNLHVRIPYRPAWLDLLRGSPRPQYRVGVWLDGTPALLLDESLDQEFTVP